LSRALHGYSGNRFGSFPPAISASLHSNGHQLRSGIAIGHYDLVLDPQGLLDTPPPLIQLPAPLFIGSTTIRDASTHFGKVTRPDGVMLQLGQRSLAHDIWLWLPSGTSQHPQQGPLLSSSGGGSGGGDGSGTPARPPTGLLWPRGV
jgi:hypothetical protein